MANQGISSSIELLLDNFFVLQNDIKDVSGLYKTVMSEVEAILIQKTYNIAGKNKKLTAKILGISRNTLATKMARITLDEIESI
ncbi:hypothetical protein FACS1894113_0850 [Alphaproteobacteria bacterium]|nr:hypothetical protein FACS1894113_0850 [Alphaproteobacteria bacterium]